jgi:hypothetical protein
MGREVPAPELQPPAPAGRHTLGRNLDSSFHRRGADALLMALVLAGGGAVLALRHLLGRPRRGAGLVSLLLAIAIEHLGLELISLAPGLLR